MRRGLWSVLLLPAVLSLAVLSLAVLSIGCVSVREFEEIRQEMGPESYIRINGHQIYVEVEGHGEPVVFLHGFGASTYSWKDVIPAIAHDYRTIALDLYGFGYTERPVELEEYTRSTQVDLVRRVMDALGVKSAHVVAHSYGGAIAMTLAQQFPERVRSLVLIDAAGPEYPAQRRHPLVEVPGMSWAFLRGFALRPIFMEWVMKKSYERREIIDDQRIEAYLDRIRVEGINRAYRGLTWPRNAEADTVEVPLEDIHQPTLVIWGKDDPLIDVELGRAGAARIPDSRFVVLPDCGHSPQEEYPEKVVRWVRRFLKDVTKP